MRQTDRELLTLDAFRQVAEVEDVVRLGGRGQEVGAHSPVDLAGRLHDRIGALPDRLRKIREEPAQYRLETNERTANVGTLGMRLSFNFVNV